MLTSTDENFRSRARLREAKKLSRIVRMVNLFLNTKMPMFIKLYSQNNRDFFLVNLANITHVSVNKKSGTCMVSLINKQTITCFPVQASSLLKQISEYNRKMNVYLANEQSEEMEF